MSGSALRAEQSASLEAESNPARRARLHAVLQAGAQESLEASAASSAVFETVWLGRGGQGAFTAARLLGLAAVKHGARQALAFPSFGPERRGAPVFAYTKLAGSTIADRSPVLRAHAAVILDESLLEQVPTPFLHEDTLVVVDSAGAPATDKPVRGRIHRIDAKSLAHEVLGTPHTNTVLLGFFVGLSGLLEPEHVEASIAAEFGSGARGQKNALAFRRAWKLGREARA